MSYNTVYVKAETRNRFNAFLDSPNVSKHVKAILKQSVVNRPAFRRVRAELEAMDNILDSIEKDIYHNSDAEYKARTAKWTVRDAVFATNMAKVFPA